MARKNPTEKIFLTGFMGAGKSSAGAALARILDVPFCDLDALTAERNGAPVAEIISSMGEPKFRKIESRLLAEICRRPRPEVISTGGGAVISLRNRRIMRRSGVVIYLKAGLKTLMSRISKDKGASRPLLDVSAPFSRASEIFAARKRFYEQADFTVETDALTAEESAQEVARLLTRAKIPKRQVKSVT